VNSLLDASFEYAPGGDADLHHTFDRLCEELGDREGSEERDADADGTSVWLECNGDLVDAWTVKTLGVRTSAPGVDIVEFVCPRCGAQHESLRFR
jgi:hypothetical protein